MRELLTRILFGSLFGIVLILGITTHPITFFILFFTIVVLGTFEFYSLAKKNGHVPQTLMGLLGSALLFGACFLFVYFNNLVAFWVFILIVSLIPVVEMYRKKANSFGNIAYTFMGIVYVALPFSLLNFIVFPFGDVAFHWQILMGIFILIWANDTGAYLVGVNFGKHRLFERISPKKSWEGSFGGALTTLLTGFIISRYFKDLNATEWLITSAIVIVFGSLGDLTESLLKRSIKVKDSGKIIPGHGGLLDRFDAILLISPVFFVFFQVLKKYFH